MVVFACRQNNLVKIHAACGPEGKEQHLEGLPRKSPYLSREGFFFGSHTSYREVLFEVRRILHTSLDETRTSTKQVIEQRVLRLCSSWNATPADIRKASW